MEANILQNLFKLLIGCNVDFCFFVYFKQSEHLWNCRQACLSNFLLVHSFGAYWLWKEKNLLGCESSNYVKESWINNFLTILLLTVRDNLWQTLGENERITVI